MPPPMASCCSFCGCRSWSAAGHVNQRSGSRPELGALPHSLLQFWNEVLNLAGARATVSRPGDFMSRQCQVVEAGVQTKNPQPWLKGIWILISCLGGTVIEPLRNGWRLPENCGYPADLIVSPTAPCMGVIQV